MPTGRIRKKDAVHITLTMGGLDVWVYSKPYGDAVASTAADLRKLMRRDFATLVSESAFGFIFAGGGRQRYPRR
jgi:hypothetical protein